MPTNPEERAAAVRHSQRVCGQATAVASMIASNRPFADVAQQVLAARGSLDALLLRLVELELADCVPNRARRTQVDELLRAALGHGRGARHRGAVRPS